MLGLRVVEEADDQAARFESPHAVPGNQERGFVSGVAVTQAAVSGQHAVQHRDETRFERLLEERVVDLADRAGRLDETHALREEDLLDPRTEQAGRGTLAGDIAEREAQRVVVERDILVEIAASHLTRHHLRRRDEVAEPWGRLGQQGPLELVCGARVLLETLLFLRFLIQPGILDGAGRFVC